MAFVWSEATYHTNRASTVPLTINSEAQGTNLTIMVNAILSKGIIEACKGTVYFRFGVDMVGHKVGFMAQGHGGNAWRKMRVDKHGRLIACIRASIYGIHGDEIAGQYQDFRFDKNDQFWVADIRKRQIKKR